jgi:hypothetical protein
MANILLLADDAVRVAAYTYGDNKIGDQNADMDNYGSGKSYIRSQPQMRRKGFANNWRPLLAQNYVFLGGVPQIAYSASHVQRGETLSTIASSVTGIASYPTLSNIISPALRFVLPSVFGAAGSAAMASVLAVLPAYGLGKAAAAGVRYFGKFGYRLRHIEQGGDYQDTATALNLRMRAVSDMSSAMSYSRRWLGNEALFMR